MIRGFRHWGSGGLMRELALTWRMFCIEFIADMFILASLAQPIDVKCPSCPFGEFAGGRTKTIIPSGFDLKDNG